MAKTLRCSAYGRLPWAFVVGAVATLCGCSGDNVTVVFPDAGSGQLAQVTVAMSWTTGTSFVAPTARSLSVVVNGSVPRYLNNPSTTMTVAASVGAATFEFRVFDEQNGMGNVLGQGIVTQTVALDTPNSVSATLNGVVRGLRISLGARPNAGTAATVPVNVNALDADGNVILGPGDYSTPILLSINDPTSSGTLSLSTSIVQTPGATVSLNYNGGTLASASIVAAANGVSNAVATLSPRPTIYEYALPTPTNRPQFIAAGSDGNMWFTESPGNKIGKITPQGVVTEYAIPTPNSNPQGIIGAADGALWFAEFSSSKIGKITIAGVFTEFSTLFAGDGPQMLVDRGDGNAWFSGLSGNHVGFQGLTSGVSGETTIPTASSQPYGIATSPDDYLYFTESAVDKIGRIPDLFGAITEIFLTSGSSPHSIVRGPDGKIWFTETGTSRIGRLDPRSFSVDGEFPTTTPSAQPLGITVGLDGALWFTESGLDRIGRVTTDGVVSEYPIPSTGTGVKGIATGPDGSLWFTEPGVSLNPGKIGRLVY